MMMKLGLKIFAAMLLTGNIATAAGLYKWVDDAGVTHFSTRVPPGQQADPVKLRRQANIVAPDSVNQFLGLARLSAPQHCQRSANQEACVNAQISAARAVGKVADQTKDPTQRFHIQACQQRHLLHPRRAADFVALQGCVGGIGGIGTEVPSQGHGQSHGQGHGQPFAREPAKVGS